MGISDIALSKAVSHALRHEPWLYELVLDGEGWVPVDDLLDALRRTGPRWRHLSLPDLEGMIERSAKARYEIDGRRIRARYGHSLPGRIVLAPGAPPDELYHGTSPALLPVIRVEGLRPMARQYVHLSTDRETAVQVGRRKASEPTILVVRAGEAAAAGVPFWYGNDQVWLTDHLPPAYLGVEPAPS